MKAPSDIRMSVIAILIAPPNTPGTNNPRKSRGFVEGARKSVLASNEIASDRNDPQSDIVEVVAAWPSLPEALKNAILAIVDSYP